MEIVRYEKGEFPEYNKFYKDFYFFMRSDSYLVNTDKDVMDAFISHRSLYISDICKSVAYITKTDVPIIHSYLFYRVVESIGTVCYFAYTKKDLRKQGLMSTLMHEAGVDKCNGSWVSYIGSKSCLMASYSPNFTRYGL